MNLLRSILFLVVAMAIISCASLRVTQRPITWTPERDELTLAYMEDHYDMYVDEPTIHPQMVLVHWTAIPTLEGSFKAFNPVRLPSFREKIATASALNVSIHYLVDQDGTIYQLMPENKMARHVIGLNHTTIGIENVGDGKSAPLTDAQLEANIKLIKDIANRYPIEYVVGHHEYQNFIGHPIWKETDPNYLTEKVDPGDVFMTRLREKLTGLNLKPIPEKTIIVSDEEEDLHKKLYDSYSVYKEASIVNRRFKHADIMPLIEKAGRNPDFDVQRIGQSIEGKSINLLSYGGGDIPVYLWSQMHGNEATATMALMDIFNFLASDAYSEYRDLIKDKLRLHFIPMLNPDGADRFVRHNTNDVDLNRDALRLVNPEAEILKRIRDSVNAQWGFNLHDQNVYYAAGRNPFPASISFLAPAYNYPKDINRSRANSMKLIGKLNGILQNYIPRQVAKYNDAFEPRAFGDNIQKWGTSTILIESGGLQNDREKQELRRLHYVALLTAFHSIATESYAGLPLTLYENIPFNNSNGYHELILRKARVKRGEKEYVLDLAFRQSEVNNLESESSFYLNGFISDVGDLSFVYGYHEVDASAYDVSIGKTYDKDIASIEDIHKLNPFELYKEGITDVIFTQYSLPYKTVNGLAMQQNQEEKQEILRGQNPSLVLSKNGIIEYVVINGELIKLE